MSVLPVLHAAPALGLIRNAGHYGRRLVSRWRRLPFIPAALVSFLVLVILLELLPTGEGPLQDTISMYALGPYGDFLRVALLCLGLGSYAVAATFWRSIDGRCGRLLGALTCVWATGSLLDACISASPAGEWTLHGEIHVQIAVVAFAALVVAVTVFARWLRFQRGAGIGPARVTTLSVFGAATAEIIVTAARFIAWGGLAERLVFASSVCWMLAAIKLLETADPPEAKPSS